MRTGSFLLLAIIGMLSAAVGAYYYLRLVVVMYFRPAGEPDRGSRGLAGRLRSGHRARA